MYGICCKAQYFFPLLYLVLRKEAASYEPGSVLWALRGSSHLIFPMKWELVWSSVYKQRVR